MFQAPLGGSEKDRNRSTTKTLLWNGETSIEKKNTCDNIFSQLASKQVESLLKYGLLYNNYI